MQLYPRRAGQTAGDCDAQAVDGSLTRAEGAACRGGIGSVCAEMLRARVLNSRILCVTLVAAAAAFPPAVMQASAAPAPALTVTPTQGPPGTRVTASGTGFCSSPCTAIEIDLSSLTVVQSVAVGGDGTFHTTFLVPGSAQAGPNQVVAIQHTAQSPAQTVQARAEFDVTPGQPAPGTSATPPQRISPQSTGPQQGGSPTSGASSSSTGTTSTASPDAASPPAGAGSSAGPPPWLVAVGALAAVLVITGIGALVYRASRST